ncbi:hypothetical protein PC116_g14141 [Phytophthora cactorum]|nr:hypothetical protein Pcac1_g3664 [Phytophthora cactorum]KAG2823085.1 hypothetical protein PC111_g10385 [Phytophthora cactorum]KAG4237808.1 hypothetical protein PC116_g14141 [Phytophthora cactorum]
MYALSRLDLLLFELTRVVLAGDKMKATQQSATTLQNQVSEIQGRFNRLESESNGTHRQHDEALRSLALVAATASDPIWVPGAPDLHASAHNAPSPSDQARSSSLRTGSTHPVSNRAHSSGVPIQSSAQAGPFPIRSIGVTATAAGSTRSSGSIARCLDLTASSIDPAPSKRAQSRSPSGGSGTTRPRK